MVQNRVGNHTGNHGTHHSFGFMYTDFKVGYGCYIAYDTRHNKKCKGKPLKDNNNHHIQQLAGVLGIPPFM